MNGCDLWGWVGLVRFRLGSVGCWVDRVAYSVGFGGLLVGCGLWGRNAVGVGWDGFGDGFGDGYGFGRAGSRLDHSVGLDRRVGLDWCGHGGVGRARSVILGGTQHTDKTPGSMVKH